MSKESTSINIERDLDEIAALIWGYMDKTYLAQFKTKIEGYRSECENNLGKEAQLLRAIIPFMPEEKPILKFILDAIIYNDIIEKSFTEYKHLETLYRDDNKDRELLKKLTYKLIMYKLITAIERGSLERNTLEGEHS
ncbi:hypothetical protein CS063_07775 [Sporanaerobium hydrogeniformans]|uniref:Uncharacterized protein n=1 Tax=Sporanaerobium hydrogeniformans TaxID=3072179 RepID=A0AC61DDX3_9FIRM|nr:hypothetical protein [Sporanaerobium hydrogeniformans]PHV70911.1 hypothetical protein CS063_07775 [Sporanaerobium hydrogeniformans]